MRWTIGVLTLALIFGAGIYLQVTRIAHKKAEVREVNHKDEGLKVRDVLNERFPEHPVHLEREPTLCAQDTPALGVVQVGCGTGRSRPVQMAARKSSSSLRN
jgi:hypothetical protein